MRLRLAFPRHWSNIDWTERYINSEYFRHARCFWFFADDDRIFHSSVVITLSSLFRINKCCCAFFTMSSECRIRQWFHSLSTFDADLNVRRNTFDSALNASFHMLEFVLLVVYCTLYSKWYESNYQYWMNNAHTLAELTTVVSTHIFDLSKQNIL